MKQLFLILTLLTITACNKAIAETPVVEAEKPCELVLTEVLTDESGGVFASCSQDTKEQE